MRKNTTYIIDFDSTIVQTESLDELARIALHDNPHKNEILDELQTITNLGMEGKMTFDESLARRLRLFSATRAHVGELIKQLQTELSHSVLKNRAWFLNNKDNIYVVSGGFADYILPVVAALGIPTSHVVANAFTYDGDTITGYDPTSPLCKAKGKVSSIESLQLEGYVVIIGDGYTDYEVKLHGNADEFWAFTENIERPNVCRHADRLLHSFDAV